MRRIRSLIRAGVASLLVVGTLVVAMPQNAQADSANAPSLVISQLKITSSNGQFITLYNSGSSVLDMSRFQLEYFNNYDLSKATSSRLIALSGSLAPHSYFMVSDDDLLLCYKMSVDSVSLGLSSTSGMVQVLGLNQSTAGGSVAPTLEDYVGWTKTAANGAQTLPSNTAASLIRRPIDATGNPNIFSAGQGTWVAVQPDSSNPCNLVSATAGSTSTPISNGLSQLLPSTQPPVTIIYSSESSQPISSVNLPTSDIGLMAPQISELLPNPSGSGNDGSAEFIELYNPNSVPFDLSGFSLQTGTTNLKTYTFASGTMLAPLSFTAYYSSKTKLSLSNSSSQARLLDPSGNSIAITPAYSGAKDGQSWALADSKWYWTSDVTPGLANIIRIASATKKSATTSKSSKTGAAAKAKAIKAAKKAKPAKKSKVAKPKKSSVAFVSKTAQRSPIHPGILALVGGLALLYVAYEYRGDIRNYFHKLGRNFKHRTVNRQELTRRRSHDLGK